MRASLVRDSRACATTSRSRSRTTSKRRWRGVRGKVVLKIFGTDLEGDARRRSSRRRTRSRRCRASSTSASTATRRVPQLQIVLDRAGAGARGHQGRRPRRTSSRPRSPARSPPTLWEGERPVPVRADPAAASAREPRTRSASSRCRRRDGGSVPLRELAQHRGRGRRSAAINREANSRVPRAQVQRRRARHGLGGQRTPSPPSTRERQGCPRATTSCGAASSRTSSARWRACEIIVPIALARRARAAVQRAQLGRAARSRSCSPRRSR